MKGIYSSTKQSQHIHNILYSDRPACPSQLFVVQHSNARAHTIRNKLLYETQNRV